MMITAITVVCAATVAYASFCRLSKTDVETQTSVRLGIVLLAGVSLFTLSAPFLWKWQADLIHLGIFLGLAIHQIATRKTWQHGVPHGYLR